MTFRPRNDSPAATRVEFKKHTLCNRSSWRICCSDRQTSQPPTRCQQTGIILSVEALQCMLAKLACRSGCQSSLVTEAFRCLNIYYIKRILQVTYTWKWVQVYQLYIQRQEGCIVWRLGTLGYLVILSNLESLAAVGCSLPVSLCIMDTIY